MLMQALKALRACYQLAQIISVPRLNYATQRLVQNRLENQGKKTGSFSLLYLLLDTMVRKDQEN